jgi:septum formation protein
MEPLILASGSPRRQDYFRLLGLPFTVLPAMIEEIPQEGIGPRQTAEDFAIRKTRKVIELVKTEASGADTPLA